MQDGKAEHLRNRCNIIDMVTECDEEIEEQLGPAGLHLHLHSAAAFECATTTDYEGEVMCSKFGVSIGCVGVSVASR